MKRKSITIFFTLLITVILVFGLAGCSPSESPSEPAAPVEPTAPPETSAPEEPEAPAEPVAPTEAEVPAEELPLAT
ncbi:MAG: hypothetical protein K0B14_11995 [Anaerolineaceae bacterium]|nr:hypothetical protein [Anaerolineaceae bacterium]